MRRLYGPTPPPVQPPFALSAPRKAPSPGRKGLGGAVFRAKEPSLPSSPPRRRGPSKRHRLWVPAIAGTTKRKENPRSGYNRSTPAGPASRCPSPRTASSAPTGQTTPRPSPPSTAARWRSSAPATTRPSRSPPGPRSPPARTPCTPAAPAPAAPPWWRWTRRPLGRLRCAGNRWPYRPLLRRCRSCGHGSGQRSLRRRGRGGARGDDRSPLRRNQRRSSGSIFEARFTDVRSSRALSRRRKGSQLSYE